MPHFWSTTIGSAMEREANPKFTRGAVSGMFHWIIWLTMVLSQLSLTGCGARRTGSPSEASTVPWELDALHVRVHLETLLLEELSVQREAWRAAEQAVHRVVPNSEHSQTTAERILGAHCDFELDLGVLRTIVEGGRQIRYVLSTPQNKFKSRKIRTAICPAWIPARRPVDDIVDHTVSMPTFSERTTLLLDSAFHRYPAEPFFVKQLVRVLVNRGENSRADTVLQQCEQGVLCDALRGYVKYQLAQWDASDSLFRRVLAIDQSSLSCGWTTLTELYRPPEDWRATARCRGNSMDSTGWWLAWPLWSETVNHRWLAHVSRHIDWALRADLPRDLYWYTEPNLGGDAAEHVFLRYGQPSHVYNAGDYHDRDHEKYLNKLVGMRYPKRPYGLPEYARDNQSMFASTDALIAPLAVANNDFHFSQSAAREKWPAEFFLHPRGSILSLPEPQRALLRRDGYALLVASVRLPVIDSAARSSTTTLSLLSQSPNGALGVVDERQTLAWGSRAVLMGAIDRPAVLSLEALGAAAGVAGARYRWGIPTIPTWRLGERCVVSDPVFLELPLEQPSIERIRERVRADLRFPRGSATGLYFESYGFHRDTVDIQVSVEDALQRAADSPLLQERLLSIAWREYSSPSTFLPVARDPSTQGRQLSLDLAALRPGEYLLRIRMAGRGCEAATSVRRFVVQ